MEILQLNQLRGSFEEISFDLSSRNQLPPSQQTITQNQILQYSSSFISTHKQSIREINIAIQVQHEVADSVKDQLPKIEWVGKEKKDGLFGDNVRYCLNQVIEKARVEEKNKGRYISENQQLKKLQKVQPSNRRSLSMSNDAKDSKDKSKQRSKTMLNLSILNFLRENQENHSPAAKETRRKTSLRHTPKEKQHLIDSSKSSTPDKEKWEILNKGCMAKKMFLGSNLARQKKYLRKITEKRPVVRHIFSNI